MGEDNNFSDFSGWNLSNTREQEMAIKRRQEEEKAQNETQSKAAENGGNASQGIIMNTNGTVGQMQDPTQKLFEAPQLQAPTSIPQQTNMAVSQQANGGMTWKDLISQGFDVNASTSPEEVADPNFDKEYRGSRAAEAKNMEAQSKLTDNGGNASAGITVDANGKVLPIQDNARKFINQPTATINKPSVTVPEPKPTSIPEPEDDELEESNMPKNWDEFRAWYDNMQKREKKARDKNTWWELMTRGLVGAANLYGTTQGAPALDLSASKDAFDNKDAYARLEKEKTNMFNIVNKEIERRQKAEAAILKEKEINARITKMEAEIAQKQREWDKKASKYDTEIALAEQRGETERARTLKAQKEAELKEFEVEHMQDTYELKKRKDEASIHASEAAAYKNRYGSPSSGKTKSKGAFLVGIDGKKRYYGSNPDWIGMARAAGALSSNLNKVQNAKEWIANNCNNPKLKQFEVE